MNKKITQAVSTAGLVASLMLGNVHSAKAEIYSQDEYNKSSQKTELSLVEKNNLKQTAEFFNDLASIMEILIIETNSKDSYKELFGTKVFNNPITKPSMFFESLDGLFLRYSSIAPSIEERKAMDVLPEQDKIKAYIDFINNKTGVDFSKYIKGLYAKLLLSI
jgi:hypothetical protein